MAMGWKPPMAMGWKPIGRTGWKPVLRSWHQGGKKQPGKGGSGGGSPRIHGHEPGVEVLEIGEAVTQVKRGDQCSVETLSQGRFPSPPQQV